MNARTNFITQSDESSTLAYKIVENCIGCTACTKRCPTGAISGVRDSLHMIDPRLCIDCGACGVVCPPEAIVDDLGDVCRTFPRKEAPVAKIIEGKVNKFLETACLLEQGFVKNPDIKVDAHVGAVAKALGTDRASLYYYIGNKRELFDEVWKAHDEWTTAFFAELDRRFPDGFMVTAPAKK